MDAITKAFVDTVLDIENALGPQDVPTQLDNFISSLKNFERPVGPNQLERIFLSLRSTYLTELDIEAEQASRRAEIHLLLLGTLHLCAHTAQHCIELSKKLNEEIAYWTKLKLGRTPIDKYWYLWLPTPWFWAKSWYFDLPSPRKQLLNNLKALDQLSALNHVFLGGLSFYLAYRKKEIQFESIRELCSTLLHHLESFSRRFSDTIVPAMSNERHRYHKSRWSRPQRVEQDLKHDDPEHPARQLEEASWDLDRRQQRIAPSDRQLYVRILALSPQMSSLMQQSRNAASSSYFGPPPVLSRGWTLVVAATIGSAYSLQKGYTKFDDVVERFHEAKQFFSTFFFDWVVTPITNIYKTIRYNNNTDSIVTERALQTDVESLARMVENWNLHRNPKISPEFVHTIGESARLGDISSIMKAYEESVSSPIKNAIMGDFLELVLIQVQKQKVDAEKGIVKLDRLLQQNELNFQLFAAIPAISIVWGLWRLLTRETHPFTAVYHQVRLQLRAVSILLNRNNIETAAVQHRMFEDAGAVQLPMSFEQTGIFVSAIVRLQKVARYLPPDVKEWFVEDLHELANPRYGVQQKLATVARMYGTYGFLSGLAK